MKIEWQEWTEALEDDGMCLDVVIANPTMVEWEAAMAFMLEIPGAAYEYDRVESPPMRAEDVVGPEGHRSMISAVIDGVQIQMFFMADDEIEFTVWPRDLKSETRQSTFIEFVMNLGRRVGKKVQLFNEGSRENALLSFDPVREEMWFVRPTPVSESEPRSFLERPYAWVQVLAFAAVITALQGIRLMIERELLVGALLLVFGSLVVGVIFLWARRNR
jgi:hypothetical protein